jgi:hypothetical protein
MEDGIPSMQAVFDKKSAGTEKVKQRYEAEKVDLITRSDSLRWSELAQKNNKPWKRAY